MPDATAKSPFAGVSALQQDRAAGRPGAVADGVAGAQRQVDADLAVAPYALPDGAPRLRAERQLHAHALVGRPQRLDPAQAVRALAHAQAATDDDRAVLAAAHVGDRA